MSELYAKQPVNNDSWCVIKHVITAVLTAVCQPINELEEITVIIKLNNTFKVGASFVS